MLQIKPQIDELIEQGKTIALCVAAKPNKHHYDQRLVELGFNVDDFTILGREDKADWSSYAGILILGGETKELYEWMYRTEFSVEVLKSCKILAGDSAGAYVLSGKTLINYMPDGSSFEIVDGFLPGLNQLVAAHINNSHYHMSSLGVALHEWCKSNDVEYLELEENQITIMEI